jgi:hypothetical protein
MIYRMSCDVADTMHTRKFPVAVHYGEERVGRTVAASALVLFSRDDEGGDQIVDVVGSQRAPVRKGGCRMLGVVVDVFAQAPLSGARLNEHQSLCDQIVDGLQLAIQDWAQEGKALGPVWGETRYLRDDEVDKAEQRNGVVYRMRFRVGRGVYAKDFEGLGPDNATIAHVAHAIEVVAADGATIEEIDYGNTTPGD